MHIIDLVGNTPLVELTKIAAKGSARIFAKAEFLNPSGSIKDRAVKAMIEDGIAKGVLTKDKTIIDATSGNSGISYAMIGANLGYKVKIFLPANASKERKNAIRFYGAEIIQTDPLEGSDGAFLAVQAEVAANPEVYFYPDQYHNPANFLAHYHGTAEEIWRQTNGAVTHFVSVMGTTGTFTGTAKRLKERNNRVKAFSVQPDSPFHGIEGTKHLTSTLGSSFFDATLVDQYLPVSTDNAYKTARRLAKEEGLFVGVSAGANVYAAVHLAASLSPDEQVITTLPDGGLRYISDSFWDEQ
ncbi:cysteine synthase B [Campylobacterota bacterium]|nr:cysteine synthase B [Campylobacterota bacterium]